MVIIKRGSDTELVDIEWCWKPLLPFGKISMIAGSGGDGKTTLILTVAAMLSNGMAPPALERGHLLPSQPCEPINIFYLTNEDEVADSSLKRFKRAGGDDSRFFYSGELQKHMTLEEEDLKYVINKTKCRLIIIDPIQAFLPDGVQLTNQTKMRRVTTMLSNVAKDTGVAIVLVGHLNKNESSKIINKVGGTADLVASTRSVLLVEMSNRHRDIRWVKVIKSNFDESDFTPIRLILDDERKLSFAEFEENDEESDDSDITDEDPRPVTKIERAMQILEVALSDGPVSVSAIHDLMEDEGIGDKTAQRAKTRIGAAQDYIDGTAVWKLE
ncbi:MAG: AAA family ATPase [Oribacterium sp.]|nr:AAA family ATPase [Oribacterium sp.]